MANEAAIRNIPPEGYEGGILIDEMSIQSDLQFSKVNGKIQLIGFTDLTPESIVMDKIKTGKKERQLATHVLQFVFIGFTGFRFPFAHFPSVTASGSDLYLLFWKAVHMLAMFNFKVTFVSTDGAQSNRDLMHILLPDFSVLNPTTVAFKNIYNRDNGLIFFIMDFSHMINKYATIFPKVVRPTTANDIWNIKGILSSGTTLKRHTYGIFPTTHSQFIIN